jgi:hypothetical protein
MGGPGSGRRKGGGRKVKDPSTLAKQRSERNYK